MRGREAEAGRVRALLERGRSVLIVGEAGIGKTALVTAVASERADGALVGGGLASLSWHSYLPLQRALGRTLPADRDAAATTVREAARGRLLVLEDLHWADDATLDLLGDVADDVLVLATVRAGDSGESATRRAGHVLGAEEVVLGPLPDEVLTGLAAERTDLGPAERADLVARSAGNPLLFEQLVATGTPSTLLEEALQARIAGLSPPALELAAILGLLGKAVDAADRPGAAELVEQGVAVTGDDGVELRLAIFGEAALVGVGEAGGAGVHAAAARLCADPGQAARHHEAAGEPELALAAALQAADAAGSAEDLAEHLAVAARCSPPAERRDRAARAAAALVDIGDHGGALAVLDALGPAASDSGELARLHAAALHASGRPIDARRVLERAAMSAGDHEVRAALAGILLWPFCEPEAALQLDSDPKLLAVAWLTGACAGPPPDLPPGVIRALVSLASGGGGAAPAALAPLDVAARPRADRVVAEALARTHELWTTGACESGVVALEQLASEPVLAAERPPLVAHVAVALGDSGRTGEALAILQREGTDDLPAGHRALLTWATAEVELAAGRPVRARKAASAAAQAVPSGFPAAVLASVCAAWTALDHPEPPELRFPATGLPALAAAEPEARGVLALAAGKLHEAEEALAEAGSLWAGRNHRAALRCRWAAAEARRQAGDRTAAELLDALEEEAAALGQRAVVARTRASLRLLGIRRRARSGTDRTGLSQRETEVLLAVAEGATSGEIAHRLGIARSTVDTIADSARRKLGARNRRHAAALLVELRS